MKNRFHGVFSLCLVAMAILIGAIVVFRSSAIAGGIYLLLVMAAGLAIIYSYCTKCPCNSKSCRHVLPGKLVRFFPSRPAGPYKFHDFLLTGAAIAAIIIYPQFWLIKLPVALLFFWSLLLLGFTEILIFVCRGCPNNYCPVQGLRNQPTNAGRG